MKTVNDVYLQPINSASSVVENSGSTEEFLDLSRIAHSLLRKWWVIAGVALASTTVAALKVLNQSPTYVSGFEVLVRSGSVESEVIANIPETLSGGVSNATRPAPIVVDEDLLKILKSPKVISPIIEKVRAQQPELCALPDGYEVTDSSLDAYCYEAIAAGLSVSALSDALDERSTIVQVAFRHEEPQVVQVVLAELSQAYLDYSLESKKLDIQRGIEFVEQKLPDLQSKVGSLQTELQNLRLQNDLIDPSARAQQLSTQIGSFTQEQRELQVQLQQAESAAAELRRQAQIPQQQATSIALNDNPRYQDLLDSLQELDTQIAEASTIYLDAAPDMAALQEQRQNLLTLLEKEGDQSQREMLSQIRQLKAREQALAQTLQELNGEVGQLTGVTRSYDDIQRDLGIATDNLNQFLAKREALQIDAAQREIPWELVTPPTVPTAQTASLFKYLILAGAVGLLLGSGLALLIDESAGIIYAEDDVKRKTRLPILGTIPTYQMATLKSTMPEKTFATVGKSDYQKESDVSFNNGHRYGSDRYLSSDPFTESFKALYTNLRLLNTSHPIRSLAISSTMPGEGKSTVAMHLADAAASAGKRVLLVDVDLRNPSLHHYLEISNEKGITNLFSGEVNAKAIKRLSEALPLYVMPVGSVSTDPNRIFSSSAMDHFVKQVGAKFDLVIYDTPPLIGQSDAFAIASKTDGLLLVVQPGKLKQSLLNKAMEQIKVAGVQVLGIVSREA